ncbi:SDR family oxidoreductase [Actinocorallia sp. API 0066]|uniref:SDR family NAD(P)-dependent oxidoreductase n=1 Tax=Actinocorallia sp. API 0066 TaxID=2896846 RepID=UPI001E3015A2|nr:SDR family oxidoreductase [Actinocorallia sp. API 0066]MCD0453541.1 SDR family oxidoreductase [Actinocorallia sp. API 0066]
MSHSSVTPSVAELTDLTGKVALVTGGAQGIGLGIVRRLHEVGANVVIADINKETAEQAAAEFTADRVKAVVGDVSNADDAAAIVRATVEAFGGLDILVNNAGIFPGAAFVDVDPEVARRTFEVNLLGVLVVSQAAARQLVEQGRGGRIITVNSVESVNPSVLGLGHYSASKHGVHGLIKTMALELAPHGITVNNVCPGGTLTPGLTGLLDDDTIAAIAAQNPLGRLAEADDIARAALFLASDLGSYLTGTQIVVDGGRTLRGAMY